MIISLTLDSLIMDASQVTALCLAKVPGALPLVPVIGDVTTNPVAAIEVLEVTVVTATSGSRGRCVSDRGDGIFCSLADEGCWNSTVLVVPLTIQS